ncbi:hypothetical protein M3_0102 [Lysinibacillus phage vB_LfM_LysYB1]|nr:hypothetical protein M3_0102 [Lysinibacillus phage vB_LfM_LysYB1]WAB25389.1 hypothetical protein M5_0211 [Lysinibacillus phage vB_LfM_LysYB2]
MSEVVCVKCTKCGTLHEKDSKSYIKIEGNVYVGDDGGIIGGCAEGERFPVNHFCHGCLMHTIQENRPAPPPLPMPFTNTRNKQE